MRVLVCGGRDFSDRELFNETLDKINKETPIVEIIHGGARGADTMSWGWVLSRNGGNPGPDQKGCWVFHADWNKHGKSAGYIRNKEMLEKGKPDLVIAFPGGRGTANMVKLAKEVGTPVIEVNS